MSEQHRIRGTSCWLTSAVLGCSLTAVPVGGSAEVRVVRPELPRHVVDTTMPSQAGRVVRVLSGQDLQRSIDEAVPGDTLVLEAGATFTGPFTLPAKTGDGWIVLITSAADRLPPEGKRVTPATVGHMARIVTDREDQAALRAGPGAHHYRLVGLEFTAAPAVKRVSAIVDLSHRSLELAGVPSHFVFDRVYIHGRPDLDSQRGLALNSCWTAVVDSWIDECHIHGFDSQAIAGWNGPGPFRIENNFLEGGSENIMFGGARNSAECMVPSDIVVRWNHLYKDPKWFELQYPNNWVVKNLFEIKTARRVLVEANVLENCWAEGQTGYAFVLKSSSPSQGRPWDTTCDLTIRSNRIINCLNGAGVARWSSEGPVVPGADPTSRVLFEHNLFERFGGASDFAKRGRGGFLFQGSGRDVTFRHNTAWSDDTLLSVTRPALDDFTFIDNLVTPGSYGVHCDGGANGWIGGLGTYLRGECRMEGNVLIRIGTQRARNMDPRLFPPGNHWFDSFESAGVDPETFQLNPVSPVRGVATDGTDPGAGVSAVMLATAGVRAEDP